MQKQTKLDFNVDKFERDHIEAIGKLNKFEQKNLVQHYDDAALNYEGIYLKAGYPDPKKCQEFVSKIVSRKAIRKDDLKIMDFACGTGLVGKYLKEDGFDNIYGIDASPKMLEIAKEKQVYKTLDELVLGQEDFLNTFPMSHRNAYDFVTAAGVISNHYLDSKIFEQMLIALKQGGIIIFASRFSSMGNYWYLNELQKMEKMGRIKALDSEKFYKYDQLKESIGKFQKTACKVYAFQKIETDSVMSSQIVKKVSSQTVSSAADSETSIEEYQQEEVRKLIKEQDIIRNGPNNEVLQRFAKKFAASSHDVTGQSNQLDLRTMVNKRLSAPVKY